MVGCATVFTYDTLSKEKSEQASEQLTIFTLEHMLVCLRSIPGSSYHPGSNARLATFGSSLLSPFSHSLAYRQSHFERR
jgi:hypothetical protein